MTAGDRPTCRAATARLSPSYCGLAVLVAALTLATAARADGSLVRSPSAVQTVPAGQVQLGLFQLSRYGITERLEIATQPLLLPVLPQVELKAHLLDRGPFGVGVRMRAAYPPLLLYWLSGEGALALLPKDSPAPHSLLLSAEGLVTVRLPDLHLFTMGVAVAAAPRQSHENTPQVDFPFLYARLAPLWTTATYQLSMTYEGRVLDALWFCAGLRAYLLPSTPGGFSLEPWANLRWLVGKHVGLELGLLMEHARYPAGVQDHSLPFVDLVVAF